MGIAAGIIGLPNVGKSTIFNALCNGRAQVENYPFCTIDPNHGVVAVPDARLVQITTLIPTKKVVPAFMDLVDIAGLVKGASKGEGLGNQFLGHIKDVQAVIHVVRCFENKDIVHVDGSIDPVRDIGTIDTELIMADLGTVERALERTAKAVKVGNKEARQKIVVIEKVKEALEKGIPVRNVITTPEEAQAIYDLHLITAKKCLYVTNVDEEGVAVDNDMVKAVQEHAKKEGSLCIKLCGKLEAEIAQLAADEQAEFLASLGFSEPGLNALGRSTYALLGLQTFFTAGPDENRAWTIAKGMTAVKAAGEIHSDIERGFIKAEIYALDDLVAYKTEAALRAAGKIRQEGKEYVMQDGDIVFYKFNV